MRLQFGSAIAVVAGLLSTTAHASFDFNPITAELRPSGANAVSTFTVTNTSDYKLPVQIYIVPREPDVDGKEVYKETPGIEKIFQIFPSQMVLNPKEKRTVRISWTGDPNPKVEIPFRVISEELPFDVDDPTKSYKKLVANVKIASRYIGSLYITPVAAQSKLEATGTPSKGPKRELILDIENKGTAHEVITKAKVVLTSMTSRATAEVQTDPLINQNVLAGKTRRFTLQWPKDLPVGPVKVSFEILKN